jgi:NADPH:quinone reductase-like Zn-dependent oxidoreductase
MGPEREQMSASQTAAGAGGTRRIVTVGFSAPRQVAQFSYDLGEAGAGQFDVETQYSGISAGTELTQFRGSNPYLTGRWDESLKLFVPAEPGTPTGQGYPLRSTGYREVGRVVASRAPGVGVGQTVCMAYGHKSGHRADADRDFFVVLPEEIDPLLGVYVAQMGPICANGLLHAAADLVGTDVSSLGDGVRGRNLLVVGSGVVGLLTALFARLHGAAEVLVADPSPYRRGIAQALGFAAVDEGDAWRWCKERWGHGGSDRGADLAFQCRAHSASLHEALRPLRPQGTVIDLAFYQGGATDLRLGEEFHHNGLAIRCAQIGRVPRGLAFAWDRRRLALETLDLLRAEGAAIRERVVTNVVPVDDAPAFLSDLGANRRDFLQVVLRFDPP